MPGGAAHWPLPENSFSPRSSSGVALAGSRCPRRSNFGCRGKVEHVLHLRHVRDLNAIEDVKSFLHRVKLIAVEVGRPLLELREVFHRTEAAL